MASSHFYCKWDFCSLAFRSKSKLESHLHHDHVAHQRSEEVFCKRRKIAPGTYILLSSQRLADRLPIRLSQTTGDITTTTMMTDGTEPLDPTTTPLYPPSFPSQPPPLPSSFVLGERDAQMDELDMYTNIISPPISPDVPHSSRLGSTTLPQPGRPGYTPPKMLHRQDEIIPQTQSSQYDLPPLSSSPFDPPTQPFSTFPPVSPSSSALASHVDSSQHPSAPSQSHPPTSSLPLRPSSPIHPRQDHPESRPSLPAQNHSPQTDHSNPSPHQTALSDPTAPSPSRTMAPPAAPTVVSSTTTTNHHHPTAQRPRASSAASMTTTTLQFGQSPGKPASLASPAAASRYASKSGESDAGRKVSGGSAGSHESVAFSWGLGSG